MNKNKDTLTDLGEIFETWLEHSSAHPSPNFSKRQKLLHQSIILFVKTTHIFVGR